MSNERINKEIDEVNFVEREINFKDGQKVKVAGISVRALIKALQEMPPDDVVVYQDLENETQISTNMIAGLAGGSSDGVVCLLGPTLGKMVAIQRGLYPK